jgi:hypothetical protein
MLCFHDHRTFFHDNQGFGKKVVLNAFVNDKNKLTAPMTKWLKAIIEGQRMMKVHLDTRRVQEFRRKDA